MAKGDPLVPEPRPRKLQLRRELRARSWKWRGQMMAMLHGRANQSVLARTRLFFILSTGRSGSQWLSELLDQDTKAAVLHEPDPIEDMHAMEAALRSPEAATQYILVFRQHKIAERIRRTKVASYGEINGMLRYHAHALSKAFPDVRLLLLSRDGREFVRSVVALPFYVPGARGAYNLEPLPENPIFEEWPKLDRIGRICWMWADSYERLLREMPGEQPIHFERMLRDYDHFEERILEPTGLRISKEMWERSVGNRSRNATRSHDFPAWPDWRTHDRDTFNRICGVTMERLGYPDTRSGV